MAEEQLERATTKRPRGPARADMRLPIYGSMTQCEAFTGIPKDVQGDAKAMGCPAFPDGGRVDLAAFLRWYFKREDGSEETEGEDKGLSHRERYDKYRAHREKFRYEQDKGRLMDSGEVREAVAGALSILFGNLERVFGSELPARAKGCDENQIRAMAEKEIESLKVWLREKFQATEQAEQTTQ